MVSIVRKVLIPGLPAHMFFSALQNGLSFSASAKAIEGMGDGENSEEVGKGMNASFKIAF